MTRQYRYEVRAWNGRLLSRHRSMFLAACSAMLWNVFYSDPGIHWLGDEA